MIRVAEVMDGQEGPEDKAGNFEGETFASKMLMDAKARMMKQLSVGPKT